MNAAMKFNIDKVRTLYSKVQNFTVKLKNTDVDNISGIYVPPPTYTSHPSISNASCTKRLTRCMQYGFQPHSRRTSLPCKVV